MALNTYSTVSPLLRTTELTMHGRTYRVTHVTRRCHIIEATHTGQSRQFRSVETLWLFIAALRDHLAATVADTPPAADWQPPVAGDVCDACKDAPAQYSLPGFDGTYCWPCLCNLEDGLRDEAREQSQHRHDIRCAGCW